MHPFFTEKSKCSPGSTINFHVFARGVCHFRQVPFIIIFWFYSSFLFLYHEHLIKLNLIWCFINVESECRRKRYLFNVYYNSNYCLGYLFKIISFIFFSIRIGTGQLCPGQMPSRQLPPPPGKMPLRTISPWTITPQTIAPSQIPLRKITPQIIASGQFPAIVIEPLDR